MEDRTEQKFQRSALRCINIFYSLSQILGYTVPLIKSESIVFFLFSSRKKKSYFKEKANSMLQLVTNSRSMEMH